MIVVMSTCWKRNGGMVTNVSVADVRKAAKGGHGITNGAKDAGMMKA